MKLCSSVLAVLPFLAAGAAWGAPPASIPGSAGESQRYSINWPSGLSLGEAELGGSRSKPDNASERLSFHFSVDAAIPGFQVLDRFRAESSPAFCSDEFEKQIQHGSRLVGNPLSAGQPQLLRPRPHHGVLLGRNDDDWNAPLTEA